MTYELQSELCIACRQIAEFAQKLCIALAEHRLVVPLAADLGHELVSRDGVEAADRLLPYLGEEAVNLLVI